MNTFSVIVFLPFGPRCAESQEFLHRHRIRNELPGFSFPGIPMQKKRKPAHRQQGKNLNNAASTTCFANHVFYVKDVNSSTNALSTLHHLPFWHGATRLSFR